LRTFLQRLCKSNFNCATEQRKIFVDLEKNSGVYTGQDAGNVEKLCIFSNNRGEILTGL